MKIKYMFLCVLLLLGINAYADDYFCLSNGGKNILLISIKYPNIDEVKYYPYLKPIKISNVVKTEYGDDGGEKPETYYTMNEIIKNKITGNYTFMSQGYIVYSATYTNLKKNKKSEFYRKYDLKLKGINCL
ncbi:hypothetical protein; putative signal peptide (plasmid) [Acinetobacter baumannii SDF]|uniref:Uncharacterized protein n=1 Tax=Acinetobacter baumannii (strain SDF) TaxID=509170 RepID=B0VVE9_ACIBS|nr:hypothetical protein; putative signal peptide [Acinetobacter baumannii SDF]